MISVSCANLSNVIAKMQKKSTGLEAKVLEVVRRLAELGAERVFFGFQKATYDGAGDFSVDVQPIAGGYSVVVTGASAVFMEFGAGVKMGGGYPGSIPAGISPIGTYGKGYGSRINGWYFTNLSGESQHTYGNPPNAVIYKTAQELREQAVLIAKEVFIGD